MAVGEAFDAVVVGAGAAGCVVAARLAESGSRSVLLLEAGPDLRAHVPDEIRDAWQITRDFDWGYTSETNPRGDVQNVWRNKPVVDPSGQVHGTEGLSVVDASIMPDVPSGFTHLPTIMIAERLSAQASATSPQDRGSTLEQPGGWPV